MTNPSNSPLIDLDMRVDFVRFTPNKITDIQEQTSVDPMLSALKELIILGWPSHISELPTDLRPFWNHKDILSIDFLS
jgi:hypothetical protein